MCLIFRQKSQGETLPSRKGNANGYIDLWQVYYYYYYKICFKFFFIQPRRRTHGRELVEWFVREKKDS